MYLFQINNLHFATKNIKPSLNLQKPLRQPTAATPPLDGNYKRFFDLVAKHQLIIKDFFKNVNFLFFQTYPLST